MSGTYAYDDHYPMERLPSGDLFVIIPTSLHTFPFETTKANVVVLAWRTARLVIKCTNTCPEWLVSGNSNLESINGDSPREEYLILAAIEELNRPPKLLQLVCPLSHRRISPDRL